jgi:hypothetical protein
MRAVVELLSNALTLFRLNIICPLSFLTYLFAFELSSVGLANRSAFVE